MLALHGLLHLLGYDHERDDGQMARLERRLRRTGGLREGLIERGAARPMTPLALFLLGCATVFLGAVQAAFSALMRLSLRLMAERGGRSDRLGHYLDDPLQLFMPVRLLLGICIVLAGVLIARVSDVHDATSVAVFVVSLVAFVVVCEHVLPMLIVRRDPERVLDLLLPVFHADRAGAAAGDARSSIGVFGPRREREAATAATAPTPAAPDAGGDDEPDEKTRFRRRRGASCCSRLSTSPRPSCAK